jgi:hypothetical protein
MSPTWPLGTVLATPHPWGRHVGVVVGHAADGTPWVAHASRRLGVVAIGPLADFAAGRPVQDRHLVPRVPADEIVRRARALEGRPYSFLTFNCEDFVGHVLGLPPRSPQRTSWLGAGGVVALLAGIGLAARRRG